MSACTFESFLQRLCLQLEKECHFTEAKPELEKNGCSWNLVIRMPLEHDAAGSFYLREGQLRKWYAMGEPVNILSRRILNEIDSLDTESAIRQIKRVKEYPMVRDSLFIRLLGKDDNRIRQAACKKVGEDLEMVLYYKISEEANTLSSMPVPSDLVRKWGVSPEKLFEEALVRTVGMYPPRLVNLEDLMTLKTADYEGEDFMAEDFEKSCLNRDLFGLCISNNQRMNGAAVVFYPGVARRLGELLDSDYYLVFTSIHEAMIHRVSRANPLLLEEILKETIEVATPEDEVLTYKIYRYYRKRDIIEAVPEICSG